MQLDTYYMLQALAQAQLAAANDEVPVGAVVVYQDKIIATAYNQPIASCNPTAHAEIIALQNAAKVLNNYRLINCTLYATLEPCVMCFGAMVHARINRLVYAATEPKTGVCESKLQLQNMMNHNHKFEIHSNVLAEQSKKLLQKFFKQKRKLAKVN